MRINDKLPSRAIDKKPKKASSSRTNSGAPAPFASRLRQSEKEIADYRLELEELKQEIDRAGDNLDREQTIANFKIFRDLIGALTKKVTTEAYRVELVGSTGITPHEHEIITVINKEADNLYRLIMSEHKDHLAITNKIMLLKGLVIDFLV